MSSNQDPKRVGEKRKRKSGKGGKGAPPSKRFRRIPNLHLQIILSCFHDDTTEADIRLFFEGCGDIVQLDMHSKKSEVIIEFEDELSVQKALKKHLGSLKEIPVSVTRKKIPTKVLIENLYYKTKDEDLLELFDDCGEVIDYNINRRKKFAIVEFSDRKSAGLATRKNGKVLDERKLIIKFHEEKDNVSRIVVDDDLFQFSY